MRKTSMTKHGFVATGSILAILLALGLSGCGGGQSEDAVTGTQGSAVAAPSGNASAMESMNLSANAASSTTVDLAWSTGTADETVARYRILRNGTAIATQEEVTEYEDSGLSASTS